MCLFVVLLPSWALLSAAGQWQGWPAYVGDVRTAAFGLLANHRHLDLSRHTAVSVTVSSSDWGSAGTLLAAARNASALDPASTVWSAVRSRPDTVAGAAPWVRELLPPVLRLEYSRFTLQLLVELVVLHMMLTLLIVSGRPHG